ncbi:MAG TPA: DUF3298 domain-containing protein [Dysgonamonadaceae bacterium]|nr:DUF3298 domain-containing protein [Dysgonamonadaceae bacterium]
MKKQEVVIAVIVLFFTINLVSCLNGKRKQNNIKFDELKLEEKVFLLPINDTTLPYSDVKIDYLYPKKFNNKEDLARLQQIFNGTFFNDEMYDSLLPKDALNKYLEDYTEEYRDLVNQYYQDQANLESSHRPAWYWYNLNKSNEILFRDESILSYSVEHSDYTGGAHGSLRVLYYTIDLNNITTVSQEDIFEPNFYHFLTDKIIEKLMEKYDVDNAEMLIDEGFFDINEIAPNNNFWINNEGVHYIYNQYEIAPYSMGPIEVTIPYNEIASIIIPNSTAGNYLE